MPRQYRTSTVSRERNRVHAQRTRQRKKEQMNTLQTRVEELKQEQINLKQVINEKNTANILVGLFAKNKTSDETEASSDFSEDPQVEELLKRPVEEIPDASKIPELPALILPGQHASKKLKASGTNSLASSLGGIDFELLGRDRSQCTPEELDKIRRERNRMHAKRTRDRKRLFTEKLSEMSRILEEENDALKAYLAKIDPEFTYIKSSKPKASSGDSACSTPPLVSPKLKSSAHGEYEMNEITLKSTLPRFPAVTVSQKVESGQSSSPSKSHSLGHLSTLLKVAGCFEEQASKKRPLSELLASAIGEFPNYNSTTGAEESDVTINTHDNGNSSSTGNKRGRVSDSISYSITAGGN